MKKKYVILIAILISVLVLSGIVILAASNYLVNYAIGRAGDGGNREVSLEVEGPTSELEKTIVKNKENQAHRTELFLEQVTPLEVDITVKDDIDLKGFVYKSDQESHLWAITIHGYRCNHTTMIAYAERYYSQGYNVLAPDLRASGESQGNYVGMGWKDKDDILEWIDWIIEQDPEAAIVIHGVSMGAATTMMTSGEDTPDNVKVFVEDCGYTSVWDIFSSELRLRFHVPEFPLLYSASAIAQLKAGYNFSEASAINQVVKSTKPMLFIHGTEDEFVPYEMLEQVYNAKQTGNKEFFIAEGAGHCQSVNVLGDEYWNRVFEFVEENIN